MQLFIRHGHVITHSDKENKNKFLEGYKNESVRRIERTSK